MEEVLDLRSRVAWAIGELEKNDKKRIKELEQCKSPRERVQKLREFFPEMKTWLKIAYQQLLFVLQRLYGLDFDVCPYLRVGIYKKTCSKSNNPIEKDCQCEIPQSECILRDGKAY